MRGALPPFLERNHSLMLLVDRMAQRYQRPPSSWLLGETGGATDPVLAFNLDLAVLMLGVEEDAVAAARARLRAQFGF